MTFDTHSFFWLNEPKQKKLQSESLEIVTEPFTDLWQRTYYRFRNDNAPMFVTKTSTPYFSFVVKTTWEPQGRFDQCGVVVYQDSEHWLKASVEHQPKRPQQLGSVVTNHGFSDWATTEVEASLRVLWYRLSRRVDDFCVEASFDGETFTQLRVCHLHGAQGEIRFGLYACSPENASFKATFSQLQLGPCQWLDHDGQAPDVL